MINILKPIVDVITKLESNKPLIHIVHDEMNNIERTLIELLPQSPLQKAEEQKVLKKIIERKRFALGNIHLAASLLNPSSQGCNLSADEMIDAIQFICNTASNMQLQVVQVRTELTDYRDKEGLWSKKFIWEGINEISPLIWWRGLRGTNLLADIAIRILSAPITSAATERTFSTFSWIHCKKRNRLTAERAAKITYLSHNWKLLNQTNAKKCGLESSQPESSQPEIELVLQSASTSACDHITDADKPKQGMKRKLFSENIEELEDSATETESEMEEEDIPYAETSEIESDEESVQISDDITAHDEND